ncbi:MAG: hypothetical protein K8J08_21730 [Thermoanaerobaculia bacterium]|nr:hypothetical protein [Thermoanaerobaculia bacterium]
MKTRRPSLLLLQSPILLLVGALGVLMPALVQGYTPFDTRIETTHRQLTWEDFQGAGKTQGRWGNGWNAHIVTTLRLNHFEIVTSQTAEGSWTARAPSAEAFAVMDKTLSGSASVAKEDRVLAHEQLHFDLAETWARRLSAELREVQAQSDRESLARLDLKAQFSRLQAAYWEELLAMQEVYDDETVHGTRKKNQKEWSRKITTWFDEAGKALDATPR